MKKHLFLTICIIFSIILSGCGKTEDEFVRKGSLGAQVSWSYSSAGVLSIHGAGATPDFEKTDSVPWEKNKEEIRSIVIDDGITSLGTRLFYDLPNLDKIVLADSVTQIKAECFSHCDRLNSVEFSKNLTEIGNSAFSYCANLKSITLPASVNFIGSDSFSCCINLSDIKTSGSVSFVGKDAFLGTAWMNNQTTNAVYLDAVLVKILPQTSESIQIDIPYGITYIAESAAEKLETLHYVNVPETLDSIGDRAFFDSGIRCIRLNEKLSKLGNDVFSSCDNLCYIRFDGSPSSLGSLSASDKLFIVAPKDSSAKTWAENFTFMPAETIDEHMLTSLLEEQVLPTLDSMHIEDGVYTFMLNKVSVDRSVVLSGYMTEPNYFTYSMYTSKKEIEINGTKYAQVRMNDVVVFCPPDSIPYVQDLYSLLPYAYTPTRNKPSLIYLNNGCDYWCKKTAYVSLHCTANAYLYPRALYLGDEYFSNDIYESIDLSSLALAEGYTPEKIREMDDFFFSGYGLYIWGLENKKEVQTQIVIENNAVAAVIIPNV